MTNGENSNGIETVTSTDKVMICNDCFLSLIYSMLLCRFHFLFKHYLQNNNVIPIKIQKLFKTTKNELELKSSTFQHVAYYCHCHSLANSKLK